MSGITIQSALAAVMEDVREVAKSDRNTSQNFNFRGIDAVVNAVGPALRKHGVVVLPNVEDYRYGNVNVGQRQTSMGHVTITVRYRFVGPVGDSLDCVVVGEAMDSGDKALAKAQSVAFRIALLQALALPTDDLDPDAETFERSDGEKDGKPKRPLTEEVWTSILGDMTHASAFPVVEAAAQLARTFDLPDDKREQLKAIYLEKKAALT
jgi:hypothetical protein